LVNLGAEKANSGGDDNPAVFLLQTVPDRDLARLFRRIEEIAANPSKDMLREALPAATRRGLLPLCVFRGPRLSTERIPQHGRRLQTTAKAGFVAA
jgi:hypothetical protein